MIPTSITPYKSVFSHLSLLFSFWFIPVSVLAAGPKPPIPDDPVLRTATPKRLIRWMGVRSPSFRLPNGQDFSIAPELSSHLKTQIIQTGDFELQQDGVFELGGAFTNDPPPNSECGESLHLSAHLSNFELEAFQFKIRFGYTPSGNLWGGISQISGSTDVRLNVATLDVLVSKCKQGICKGIAAGSARTLPATVDTQIQIDFSQIVLGIDFIHKTPLAQWMSKLFKDALIDLKKNSEIFSEIPWQARVSAVHKNSGAVTIDVGSSQGIRAGDAFWILKPQESNTCGTYLPIAQGVSTSEITPVSAHLKIVSTTETSGDISVGDVVMVRHVEATSLK